MGMNKTTCQICGREIKAKKGVIAHHGYTRPGDGWQTASCAGARYLPYEVSRDRIPFVLGKLEAALKSKRQYLSSLMKTPPDELIVKRRLSCYKIEEVVVKKPEDFNPNALWASSPVSYMTAFSRERYQTESLIRGMESQVEFLKQRFENWKES